MTTSTGRRGYVGVDRRWLANPELTDSMLRLMMWLDSHSDEYLQALHVKRTSEEIGWSRDRVKRTLMALEGIGLVSTEQAFDHRSGQRTKITLHLDLWSDPTCATRQGTPVPHDEAQAVPHGKAPTTSISISEKSTLGTPQTPNGGTTETDPSFDEFYLRFPKPGNRKVAQARWAKLKSAQKEAALQGLQPWLDYWEADETPQQYIPAPQVWIGTSDVSRNGRGWENIPPVVQQRKPSNAAQRSRAVLRSMNTNPEATGMARYEPPADRNVIEA